jgi:1-acyl-sn-glycerol-3-phosphate acyltransferase
MMDPSGVHERLRQPATHMGLGYWIVWRFFRAMLVLGWHLEVDGLERLPSEGPFILTPNHASEIDPIVVSAALPFRVTYLAGRELDRFPVIFALLRLFNPIFVRRGVGDVGALKACLERLAKGEVLVIFPEGGVVQPGLGTLHEGAAFLAVRAQVPVVPVRLIGLVRMLPLGARLPRLSRVRVRLGDPIPAPPRNGQSASELNARIRAALDGLLDS